MKNVPTYFLLTGIILINAVFFAGTVSAGERLAKIAVATPYWDPEYRSAGHVEELLQKAGAMGADLVCFPQDVLPLEGEPVPGNTTHQIGRIAKAYGMYVVGNIREKDGGATYQTSFLLDRNGAYIGKYRQTHKLPGESIELGNKLPVFTTGVGRIALTSGSDVYVPELFRAYAERGADIIVWSSSPELLADAAYAERILSFRFPGIIVLARYGCTRENPGGYIGFPEGNSMIASGAGGVLARTGHEAGIALAYIPIPDGDDTERISSEDRELSEFLALPLNAYEEPISGDTSEPLRLALLPDGSRPALDLLRYEDADAAIIPLRDAGEQDLVRLRGAAERDSVELIVLTYPRKEDRLKPVVPEPLVFDRQGRKRFPILIPQGTASDRLERFLAETGTTLFDMDFGRVAVRGTCEAGRYLDRLLSLLGVQAVIHPITDMNDLPAAASSSADNGVYSIAIMQNPETLETGYYVQDGTGTLVRGVAPGSRKVVTIEADFNISVPWLNLHPGFRFPNQWEYPDRWGANERPAIHGSLRSAVKLMRRPELYRLRDR